MAEIYGAPAAKREVPIEQADVAATLETPEPLSDCPPVGTEVMEETNSTLAEAAQVEAVLAEMPDKTAAITPEVVEETDATPTEATPADVCSSTSAAPAEGLMRLLFLRQRW